MTARTVALSQVICIFSFSIFAIISRLKQISENINRNQMKLDTLREGNEKMRTV